MPSSDSSVCLLNIEESSIETSLIQAIREYMCLFQNVKPYVPTVEHSRKLAEFSSKVGWGVPL